MSKRLQGITNDKSLWLTLNFFKRIVPLRFVEKASENGCKYLSVAHGGFSERSWNFKRPLNLKYLDMSADSKSEFGFLGVPDGLLKNCHSLEKLSVTGLVLAENDFKLIAQNSQILRILNLEDAERRPKLIGGPAKQDVFSIYSKNVFS